jgi:hypothetical protein
LARPLRINSIQAQKNNTRAKRRPLVPINKRVIPAEVKTTPATINYPHFGDHSAPIHQSQFASRRTIFIESILLRSAVQFSGRSTAR